MKVYMSICVFVYRYVCGYVYGCVFLYDLLCLCVDSYASKCILLFVCMLMHVECGVYAYCMIVCKESDQVCVFACK